MKEILFQLMNKINVNISIFYYSKFRDKFFKFSKCVTPSLNYAAPSTSISFPLIKFNFQYRFIVKQIKLSDRN